MKIDERLLDFMDEQKPSHPLMYDGYIKTIIGALWFYGGVRVVFRVWFVTETKCCVTYAWNDPEWLPIMRSDMAVAHIHEYVHVTPSRTYEAMNTVEWAVKSDIATRFMDRLIVAIEGGDD